MWLNKLIASNLYSFGELVVCLFEGDEVEIKDGQIVCNEDINDKIMIYGKNNDEPGMDSNGSGKSSLLNVIFWIIFGEIFQDERIDEILRRGTKKGYGELHLHDQKNILIIKRTKGTKDSLEVTFNGEVKTKGMNPSVAQREVLKILNLDLKATMKEHVADFLNTIYFSTATVKSFMSKDTKSPERFKIIARFLKLKNYDRASELAGNKKKAILDDLKLSLDAITNKETFLGQHPLKEYQSQIRDLEENTLPRINGEIKGIENQIAVEEDRIKILDEVPIAEQRLRAAKAQADTTLTSLEVSYKNNEATIKNEESAITAYNETQTHLNQTYPDVLKATTRTSEINNIISGINTEILELVKNKGSLTSEKQTLSTQINTHLTCPKCQEALMYSKGILALVDVEQLRIQVGILATKIEAVNTQITEKTSTIEKHNKEIESLRTIISNYESEYREFSKMEVPATRQSRVAELKAKNTEIDLSATGIIQQTEKKVNELEQALSAAKARAASLSPAKINIHETQMVLESKKLALNDTNKEIGRLQQLLTQIVQTQTELDQLHRIVGEKKKLAEMYSFWEIGFQEIKIQIIEEFLPSLEDRVNQYLSDLKVNMRVDFDTKKEKASATKKELLAGTGYKEEFNITVLKNESISPFNMLSNGERGRIAMCAGMALRELTREAGSCLLDFLQIDELADALDKTGLQETVKLLDSIHGQKLVISHSDSLKQLFDHAILVEITDGVSTITNEG